ncbi:uncharacterized protein LOC123319226 [Coccinella septempunctata]|uniref:uncharacterized protein LOC123319226 n=1 Tax=Coccinella septempunctata TaxID=41139 RepID=UPI001D0782CB|nr:uncharacterized protein LOC123319226 [Coccinella septempunctata]
MRPLQNFQNKVLRIITDKPLYTRITQLHEETDLPTVREFFDHVSSNFYEKQCQASELTKNIIKTRERHIKKIDAVSLYTNIPTQLVPQILEEKWHLIEKYTDLPKTEFIEAVQLTLGTCYFQYEDEFYQQIDGVAMGSPVAGAVAQLVLEYFEEKVLLNSSYRITIFKRYVDDCLIITTEDQIKEIMEVLNNLNNKLKFTLETELDNKINFLDMTIIRENNKIETKMLRKTINSDRILDYNSVHNIKQKKAIVTNYIDRAIKLTSPRYRPEILNQISSLLATNNYPQEMINKTIKQRTHKFYNSLSYQNPKTEPIVYIPLPYIPTLSEKIENIIKPYPNIRIAHKPVIQVNQLFSRLKAIVPKGQKSHIVYEIPCNQCNGVYIGQTEQNLNNRIKGHKYSKTQTALYKHTIENNHTFNFENTRILDREKNKRTREFLEMICIKRNPNSINDRTDINGLNKIYSTIIKKTAENDNERRRRVTTTPT